MQKKKIKIIVKPSSKGPIGKIVYLDKKDKKDNRLPTQIPNKYRLNINLGGNGFVFIENNKIIKIVDAQEKELPQFPGRQSRTEQSGAHPLKRLDLPDDTKKALYQMKLKPDNFSLWVNKVALKENDKYRYLIQDKRGNVIDHRRNSFKKLATLIADVNKRQINLYECHMESQFNDKILEFQSAIENYSFIRRLDQRMAIGLGGASVYETSMTLHHIYGIPYIPGSAVKGVARSWYIQNKHNSSEEAALKDLDFCAVFGNEEKKALKGKRGQIIFFDAFPTEPPKVQIDIMNPHYGEYYSSEGKTPPADYLKPNPIYFLTVAETPFQFMLGYSPLGETDVSKGAELLAKAKAWLMAALTTHGIGAKTAVGYGYFKE